MLAADTAVAPARFEGPPHLGLTQRAAVQSPFMVVGRVNGRDEATRATTPAEALARMLDWLRADDDASAVWYLREDWPTNVTVIGRPAPGLVGETRRATHLFPLTPGTVLYGSIIAACGVELCLTDIEWLNLGAGMPCERCLALASTQRRLEAAR